MTKKITAGNITPEDGPFRMVSEPCAFRKNGIQVAIELADGRQITKNSWKGEGNPLQQAREFVKACRANMVDKDKPEIELDVPKPDGTSKWFRDRIGDMVWLVMQRPSKARESLLRTISQAARAVAPHIDTAALEEKIERLEAEEADLEKRELASAEPETASTATREAPEPGVPIN